MLGICKEEDCIALLDEPDAHMNPRWKYSLKEIIDGTLSSATNTQALIATHDPLVINGVDKNFIRIFAYNQSLVNNNGFYFTKVYEPTEETKGMGIDGLLQSEYYGLQTSYDKVTSQKHVISIRKSIFPLMKLNERRNKIREIIEALYEGQV